jgi:hypothetical protein
VNLLLGDLENDREHGHFGCVAEAGHLLQRLLRFDRQAAELADHEVHDIVGVALGVNPLEIPAPTRRVVIEGEQALFSERMKKLNHEEWIAGGLLIHQLRQRCGDRGFATKGIRDQLPEVIARERLQADLLHLCSGLADRIELAHQRMCGIDLVVPVGADQHQILQLRPSQQILQQVERRRVEPLKIVDEQGQRMFRAGEDADEPPQHQPEAVLRLLRLELGDRRLLADDELQFEDEVGHEPCIGLQSLQECVAPDHQIGVSLAK